jgi:hypothetical protein
VVEPTGAEILVFTHLAGQEMAVVFKERHLFSPGDKINPDPAHRHHSPVRQGNRRADQRLTAEPPGARRPRPAGSGLRGPCNA